MYLLWLFSVFIQDTVYVYANFPYADELRFSYPSFSEKVAFSGDRYWLLNETTSLLFKEYGNLSSVGLRGTRTQDIDIQLNGIPLKTVQNDYADLSLLPTSLGINGIIIKHPLSSYGSINGAAGGIFIKSAHRQNAGFNINSCGILEPYISSHLWKVQLFSSFSEKNSKQDGFKKFFLLLDNDNASFILALRHAKIQGPMGTDINGDKKEFFSGYSFSLFRGKHIYSFIKGNLSQLIYKTGREVDIHRSFYNYVDVGLGLFRFSVSSEYISSTKSSKRIRNTLSLIGSKKLYYKDLQLVLNGSVFYPQEFNNAYSSYFLGASYKLKGSVFYINYTKGVHLPSFFDLYWPEDAFAKGNPNLLPEYIRQYEAGFKYISENSIIHLSYFDKSIKNMIQWCIVSQKYTPYNTGIRHIKGIEFKITHQGIVKAGFSGTLSFFDHVLYYPHVMEGFYLSYNNLKIGVSFTGRREKRPHSIKMLPCMELFNVNYKREIGHFVVEMGVHNLLDEYIEWIAGYPQTGRVFYTNIKLEWR